MSMGVLLPTLALAAVPVGQELPFFVGTDLTGTQRRSSELTGQPAVVIAATSRAASGEAQAWANEIVQRQGGDVPLVTLIAIDLPFFIPDDVALGMARDRIPHRYWDQTWLGGEGDIQRALQLEPGSDTPYVFTLDSRGRITDAIHGRVGDPAASRIWRSIQAWRR
ncbi:hypothetical protein JQX13_38075 [Archangium violaceum]|uniref:hypothetical protein n=1 Tax=Archangium violaceum TaxID=83451 RepID=UPI00193B8A62|nr:hypothetical protein [Archangium violaceum]QRK05905.1 hypothetical protein JQX13_38075 [Archangium violaceum]